MRIRVLPLLLLSFALAPAVLADNIDLRAVLSMPQTAVYNAAVPDLGGSAEL